jgi:DNA-binding MarR family transcriptional regulator
MQDTEERKLGLHFYILSLALTRLTALEYREIIKQAKSDLPVINIGVLLVLAQESCTMAALSQWMIVTPATLVPIVDDLEKKGYLERTNHTHDRRKKVLSITTKGMQLLHHIRALNNDNKLAASIKFLGKDKAFSHIRYLEQLLSNMTGSKKIPSKIALVADKDL